MIIVSLSLILFISIIHYKNLTYNQIYDILKLFIDDNMSSIPWMIIASFLLRNNYDIINSRMNDWHNHK